MFPSDQYQLLDFGDGRRLERFGAVTLDRPCPAVEGVARANPEAWQQADACFERTGEEQGRWVCRRELPASWTIAADVLHFELKRTPLGQVGLFPEQAENWRWLAEQLGDGEPANVLNLFAYTGGSTLAAAVAGAEVTHVDAARNMVAWARRNAELSRLAAAPIRWITEDAPNFVKRELRRGPAYDAVILDPPSYGHGRRGEVWRLSKHLPRLVELCGRLTAGRRRGMLLTCHTPGFGPDRLKEMMADALGDACAGRLAAGELSIRSTAGRELPSGAFVRWSMR
jgi:23S rRNA (cytosine1962-C5)-methyltransferase